MGPHMAAVDRRHCDRWPVDGDAAIFCLDADQFGRILDLRLFDCGHGGMGALSPESIRTGTRVSVSFGHAGYTARDGRVVGCTPFAEGHRVAVRFEDRLMAA